jgi:putative aldouronate transport system substrate-binding protein
MKKRFLLLVSVLFILSVVIIPAFEEVAAKAPPLSSIKAFLDTNMIRKELGQEFVTAEYKKITGIDLVITQPDHNEYYQKLLIAFASGDLPDLAMVDTDRYLQFIDEGAIIPLNDLLAKSDVKKKVNPAFLSALQMRDGKIYGFPINSGGGCVTYIRKDWLDNLGLKMPKTYEELVVVMKAFTFNDPDKNGKNDTVGCTLPGVGDEMYMRDFELTETHGFTTINNKWVDGFSQPGYAAALTRLRQAYQDKILDKEVFTNKTSTAREKFFAGKVGIFNYWSGTWAKTLSDNTKAQCGPQANVVAMPAIKGAFYFNRIAPILVITKAAKKPDAIFKYFIDFMYDGGKGQMLMTHGVKGVHWDVIDGVYTKLPALNNKKQTFGKSFIQPDLSLTKWNDPFVLDPRIVASKEVNIKAIRQIKLLPMSPTYLKKGADLQALKEEIIAKVMIGTYTVDEGIKIYKEKSEALGLSQMLVEFNK